MIRFENVAVRYPGASTRALDGVTLDAAAGAVTAVTGPNGSGKSTLVRALLRRVQTEAGTISVDGRNTVDIDSRELATRVAVAVQREEPVFPMRVRDYVSLGRYPRLGLWSSASQSDDHAVGEALSRAEVTLLADRRTDELSGGEWQRVRLARALSQEARTLVLDEPTTFLDLAHEMALFELLYSLAADGMAVLIVSHQLNLVARFASHIVLLDRGRVAAAGAPRDVMRAELLEQVYDWPLVVTRDPAVGAPSLVPLRKRPAAPDSPITLPRSRS